MRIRSSTQSMNVVYSIFFSNIFFPIFFFLANSANNFIPVLKEIEERATWLNDMIALGEGKKHKQQVMNEIAERLTLIKQIEMQQNRK